jgi:hypothetical protein
VKSTWLSACQKADFVFPRNLTGLTKGNLSRVETAPRNVAHGSTPTRAHPAVEPT